MAKRKRRVPEVLWRLFHNRARTLSDTILSLLPSPPPSPEACPCKGRRCLGCIGDNAFSYLLRPKDPVDYRKLLTQWFAVVADEAPPFSGFDPHNRWSKLEIVRRSIEMILCEQPNSSNVICSDYDKSRRMSAVVELLTSSAWSLLLRRVGDVLMVYLLKNALIFMPLPQRKYYQVAGFPISDLCPRFSRHKSDSEYQLPSQIQSGCEKKRKRLDDDRMSKKMQRTCSSDGDFPSSFASCVGCYGRNHVTLFDGCCCQKSHGKRLSEEITNAAEADCVGMELCPLEGCQKSSSQAFTLPRRRKRHSSWQRRRKRRQLSSQGSSSLIPSTESLAAEDNLCGELPSYVKTNSPFCYRRCSCCLVFQKLPKVNTRAQIDRQIIFYKLERSSSVFPRNHILNALKPNSSGANAVFKDIFGSSDALLAAESIPCFHSEHCCLIKSTCLYHSIFKQLKALIRKVQNCQHLRLLNKHCAISSLDQDSGISPGSAFEGGESERNKDGKESAGNCLAYDVGSCGRISKAHGYEPSKSYCLKKQVVSFTWAVCRSIVPRDLLGSPYNWRIFRKNISKFICLRRFEKFSLKQCMHKLKISKFPLLSNKYSSCCSNRNVSQSAKRQRSCKLKECSKLDDTGSVKHKILECLILWLFSRLVVPLLQANFYVTESENGNQEVYFYRRSIWEKLTCEAYTSLIGRSYLELKETSVRKIIESRSFGFSRIRFRPKGNGFRVLANLKASSRICVKSSFNLQSRSSSKLSSNPSNVKYAYFKSVNKALCNVHGVLKGIQMKEPEKLGSSVFDYNDVYRKFVPFLSFLKSGSPVMPGVFVIVSDVSKAFDSVDQDKLLSVMNEIISDDEYPLNKYLQVACTRKSLLVRNHLALPSRDNFPGSLHPACSVPSCAPLSILIKQDSSMKIRKHKLFFDLNEHIKNNVLQLGNRFCLQKIGIPQGSVLSSLLCSFYFGYLERNVIFPFLEKAHEPAIGYFSGKCNSSDASAVGIYSENETTKCTPKFLLLRFIDDFLFVSTSRKQALMFFSRMQRGFREYNCYMNERKFGLNFDMDHMPQLRSNRLFMGEDGISFLRWSGLLVNCVTLEIQADYSRYLNSHLSSALTVCWHDHPVCHLKKKLCDYLRPKCHPIFYDSNINSAAVVRLNIYQAFLLCAMKFHCYICNLNGIATFSIEFFMDAVEISLRYMHKLIKRRMRSLQLSSDFHPILDVGKWETEWLGLVAYSRVLKRKQSRYSEFISLLRSKMMAHKLAKSMSSALEYAVDDSHSSLVWKIKY